tara:strand:+ start:4746 stop:6020 length:1275 start_codon:yes stop_codon:yes gene_type:complete
MKKNVVIIAGGKGTRLKRSIGEIPKSLAKINKKTLFEYQLDELKKQDFLNVHLCLGLGHKEIIKLINKKYKNDFNISYTIEDTPMGTYGAIYNAKDFLDKKIFVLFGDIIFNFDIQSGFNNFKSDVLLVTRYSDHPKDSDIVIEDSDNFREFKRHKDLTYPYKPLGNTGLFFIKKNKLFESNSAKSDIFKDYLTNNSSSLNIQTTLSTNYIKDVGTTKRYKEAQKDIDEKLKEKDSVFFIDRDETLTTDAGNENIWQELEFKKDALKLISFLQKKNSILILLTNQPGIAKGFCSNKDVEKFHSHMQHLLIENELKPLDAIYFCPHHPDSGFKNEVQELKKICQCRKPKKGLVEEAIKDLNLKNKKLFFIGDTSRDYKLANKYKSKSYIVESKFSEKEYFKKEGIALYKNLNQVIKDLNDNIFSS